MFMIILFLVLTALFWGLAPIFDKIAVTNIHVLPALTFRSIVVTLFLLVATFIYGKSDVLFNMGVKSTLALSGSALSAGLLGMLTYYSALRLGPTSKIVPLAATYPLITALLGMVFLGETVTSWRLFGIILIIVGIWLVLIK